MPEVTLFCDVDGAINTYTDEGTVSAEVDFVIKNENRQIFLIPQELRWRESVVEFLSKANVNFFWLTGWLDNAPRLLDDLWGIESIDFLPWDKLKFETDERSKKLALIEHVKANPGPFIWVDDIATGSIDQTDDSTVFNQENALIIASDPILGISEKDIEKMKAFIAKHSNGEVTK